MLLPKTLDSIKSVPRQSIRNDLLDMIYGEGMDVSLLDLVFGHYFIYVLLSEGILMPVFLFEGRISYKQSQIHGLPKLHFCYCNEIAKDFSAQNITHTLNTRHYLAKVTPHNAFRFSIKQGLSDVGLYHDYPLDLCPLCSEILESLRDGSTIDSTLQVFVFQHTWPSLLQTRKDMLQKELIALGVANLKCYKCKRTITPDTPIWLHFEEESKTHKVGSKLKIYCC